MQQTPVQQSLELVRRSRESPDRFNHSILRRPDYWARQREVCRSVVRHRTTVVPAGHAVGKSYVAAGILLWFLFTRPGSRVICTAPSQTQLEEVLWQEVVKAHESAGVLGGRVLKGPLKIECGPGWHALGYSTTKPERISGHHAGELLAIIDEASGVNPEIYEAIDSLNPSRTLLIGNPLRPDGKFYERCREAGTNPHTNLVRVSSLESPDIGLARSPRGLADRSWLEDNRARYGETSLWWLARVLARFPGSSEDQVIPAEWLERCAAPRPPHRPPTRPVIAADLAGGTGGDQTVVLCRDGDGILELTHGNTLGTEQAAHEVVRLARRYAVPPGRVVFDATGLGHDFGYRLEVAGLRGAYPFKGGEGGGPDFANKRTQACFALRARLDPTRQLPAGPRAGLVTDWSSTQRLAAADPHLHSWLNPHARPPGPQEYAAQDPFHVPPGVAWWPALREELRQLRYRLLARQTQLEPKEQMAARLGRSPDLCDALIMSFALD